MHKKLRVVIVESDPIQQEAAKSHVGEKHNLTFVETHSQAMRMLGSCDIILADVIMPPEIMNGIKRWDLLLKDLVG